jgi:hypothetical protein
MILLEIKKKLWLMPLLALWEHLMYRGELIWDILLSIWRNNYLKIFVVKLIIINQKIYLFLKEKKKIN